MLHIKDEIRFFRFTVLYIICDFCFSVALTGDQIIFLEKVLWLSRISMCLLIDDSPSINYSWMAPEKMVLIFKCSDFARVDHHIYSILTRRLQLKEDLLVILVLSSGKQYAQLFVHLCEQPNICN